MQKGPLVRAALSPSVAIATLDYWPEFEAGAIGAVAEASLDAALAAIAVFDDMLFEAIAALASDSAVLAVFSAGLLQAATERAARAAPTTRRERSVAEVISRSQVEEVQRHSDAGAQYDAFASISKTKFTVA